MIDRMTKLQTFARAGWFARGVVYCLLGVLALSGTGASDASPQGVFRSVQDMPGGPWLLGLLALGLALYGAYRLYSAALDSEGKGDDTKGAAIRVGYAASGRRQSCARRTGTAQCPPAHRAPGGRRAMTAHRRAP